MIMVTITTESSNDSDLNDDNEHGDGRTQYRVGKITDMNARKDEEYSHADYRIEKKMTSTKITTRKRSHNNENSNNNV